MNQIRKAPHSPFNAGVHYPGHESTAECRRINKQTEWYAIPMAMLFPKLNPHICYSNDPYHNDQGRSS